MERREVIFRRVNLYFGFFYAVFSIAVGVYNIFHSTGYYVMLAFVAPVFLFLPALVFRIFKLKPVYQLYFTTELFCALAFVIGMVLNGYKLIPFYDKIVHTLSGVFFALIGLVFYYILKPIKQIEKKDYAIVSMFSFLFAMTSATVWEIYEYIISYVLGTDPQLVLTTGVNDTMQDIIVCLIGALILCVSIFFYYKKNKKSFLMGVFESFYNLNFKK